MLAGTLNISLFEDFLPSAGDSFDLFDWDSISGAFGEIILPELSNGLAWDDSALYATGELSVFLLGDANGDGKVTDQDFAIFAPNWQQAVTSGHAGGDFNGDGIVNDQDLAVLASNWQSGIGEGIAQAPEPGTLGLLALGGATLMMRGRRKIVKA